MINWEGGGAKLSQSRLSVEKKNSIFLPQLSLKQIKNIFLQLEKIKPVKKIVIQNKNEIIPNDCKIRSDITLP